MTLLRKSTGLLAVLFVSTALALTVITPAKASHRMVLGEELTNVY